MIDLHNALIAGRMLGGSGGSPAPEPTLITKSITANGVYSAEDDNADGYSAVSVEVPEKVLTTKTITENGTYNASDDNANGYSTVTVNVYNFFDGSRTDGIKDNKYLNLMGQEVSANDYYISYPIPVLSGKKYEWYFGNSATHQSPTVGFYDDADTLISAGPRGTGNSVVFTVPANTHHIRASVYKVDKAVAMLSAAH